MERLLAELLLVVHRMDLAQLDLPKVDLAQRMDMVLKFPESRRGMRVQPLLLVRLRVECQRR